MPNRTEQSQTVLVAEFSLKDLAELLIKHKGLNDGLYNVAFKFQIAIGAVGPSPETMFPGAMFSVSGVGLEKVAQTGPHTVDAAVVNPATRSAAKKTSVTSVRKRNRA